MIDQLEIENSSLNQIGQSEEKRYNHNDQHQQLVVDQFRSDPFGETILYGCNNHLYDGKLNQKQKCAKNNKSLNVNAIELYGIIWLRFLIK